MTDYTPQRGRRPVTPLPYIPRPEPREIAVVEQLVVPESSAHLHTPTMKKVQRQPVRLPHYNELYDSLFTTQGWRYIANAFADGTFTPTAGSPIQVAVTLAAMPNLAIDQWPGAVQAYWVLHSFACAPQSSFSGQAPVETQIPATAGNLTVFTGAGELISGYVAATGTTDLEFQDGAGNIIAEVPSTATLDQVFSFNAGFNTSLVAVKATTTPVVTITYQPQVGLSLVPGALEVAFQDKSGIAPIGVFSSANGGSSNVAQVMPNPITDPDALTIGTLLVTLQPGPASAVVYTWQLGLGVAYLLPSPEPWRHAAGDNHDLYNSHHH